MTFVEMFMCVYQYIIIKYYYVYAFSGTKMCLIEFR